MAPETQRLAASPARLQTMGVTSRDTNFVLPASPATAQISSGSLAPAPICRVLMTLVSCASWLETRDVTLSDGNKAQKRWE